MHRQHNNVWKAVNNLWIVVFYYISHLTVKSYKEWWWYTKHTRQLCTTEVINEESQPILYLIMGIIHWDYDRDVLTFEQRRSIREIHSSNLDFHYSHFSLCNYNKNTMLIIEESLLSFKSPQKMNKTARVNEIHDAKKKWQENA